jgi:GxxExxY protein
MDLQLTNIAHEIYKDLGPGYSESIYHRAYEVQLRENCIPYETERIVPIVFKGHTIGNIRADLIVNGTVIVELKAVRTLNDAFMHQVKNYLKHTGLSEGYLINFGPEKCEIIIVNSK